MKRGPGMEFWKKYRITIKKRAKDVKKNNPVYPVNPVRKKKAEDRPFGRACLEPAERLRVTEDRSN